MSYLIRIINPELINRYQLPKNFPDFFSTTDKIHLVRRIRGTPGT